MSQTGQAVCWAGIDWGDQKHFVHLLDANGKGESWQIPHSPEAIDEMTRHLRQTPGLAGVAVETNRGVLVAALLLRGLPVYAINPKVARCWREGWSVAGRKDDALDAQILAQGLRAHHAHLAPLQPDDAQTRKLAVLCEDEGGLVKRRAGLLCSLKSALKSYYPAFLEWFDDLSKPLALAFLAAFPTASALAAADDKAVFAFFKTRKAGLPPKRQERIRARASALSWIADPVDVETLSRRALLLAREIHLLSQGLAEYRAEIDRLFDVHPDAALFVSLPRAGRKLAPRLLGCFGADRERYADAQALETLSGCAPVTRRSGHKQNITFRWACRKHFRNTLHLFAYQSTLKSLWAKRCYDSARGRGASHSHALRVVGQKWIRIIFRMWKTREPYDETRHLQSLAKHGSPLAHAALVNCGQLTPNALKSS